MKVQGLLRRVLVLALSIAALPAGSALAATGHVYAGQFGAASGDAGQLIVPGGIAVSPSGSTVWVVDQAFGVVQAFDAAGDAGVRIDGSGTPNGGMNATGVAATATDVWVADGGNNVVNRFDTSGAYQSQITGADTPSGSFGYVAGVAVDPSSATPASDYVYVIDQGNLAVDVFDASGAYVRQITGTDSASFSYPSSIAVDGDGNVFVVDGGNNFVAEFAPGGTSFTRIVDQGRSPQAVAADASTGDVYVGNIDPDGKYFIADHRPDGTANEFGLDRDPPRIAYAPALAVSPSTHAVFASDAGNQVVHRFRTATLPDATTGAASSVASSTATLNGTVDPLGIDTSYRFDYGLDATYGQSSGGGYVGSAPGATPVSDAIADLQPNATYHFRVVATGQTGTELGADQTFTTDAAAPTLGKSRATAVSQATATLIAEINPNNTATTYRFEIGTDTTYGLGSAPSPDGSVGSGFGLQEVSADIAAAGITLSPDTIYHFRVVANGAGAPVVGPDRTFRTLPNAPVVVTGDATDVTPHSATVSGTVDPAGSGPGSATTYRFEYGTDTNYNGGFVPNVPADAGGTPGAVAHSASLTGLTPGTTYHYRLVATNAAGTVAGSDGTFTTPAAPPLASAEGVSDVTAGAATISGSIDPHGRATSWVLEVGTTTAYGMRWFGDAGDGVGPQAVAVRLTNLAPGTTYHYRLVATNAGGTTSSADGTFATAGVSLALPMPAAPITPVALGPGRDLSPTPAAKKPAKKAKKKPASRHKKKSKHKKKSSKRQAKKSTTHLKGSTR